MFKNFYKNVKPKLDQELPNQVKFVFRHQVQPWHPSSTLVHEAGLAVSRLEPSKFWDFSYALFEDSEYYYDEHTYEETRPQTYERLAELAHKSVGIDKKAFLDLVSVPASNTPKNAGSKITNDLKAFIRVSRQNGIHVSPTVVVDGVVAGDISSSFTAEQWVDKLFSVVDAAKL
jgi:protein-disulfide isomerase